jgi:hypothetical protein
MAKTRSKDALRYITPSKYPGRRELLLVRPIDLVERAMPPSILAPGVLWPILLRGVSLGPQRGEEKAAEIKLSF